MAGKLRLNLWASALLVLLNLALLNLLLEPFGRARIDMTEGDVYSLSEVTERYVSNLDEELLLEAFISKSENLPEELRPYAPQIRDLLREYEVRSGGRVRVEIVAPEEDSDAQQRAENDYGIQPRAFAFREKTERGVRSFYLGIAVVYAGNSVTIPTNELVEPAGLFEEEQSVQLKNVEFAVTRAIKKAVTGFESQRDVFDRFDGKAVVRTYFTPEAKLPEALRETPGRVLSVLEDLVAASGGKVRHEPVEIPDTEEGQLELLRRTGVRPLVVPGIIDEPTYVWATIQVDEEEPDLIPFLSIDEALTEFQIRKDFEEYFKRRAKGILRTVAIVQDVPQSNPMMAMQGGGPQPQFAALEKALGREYEVRSLDVNTLDRVPRDVDLAIVTGRGAVPDRALYALDQFVMRGGKAVFLVDGSDVNVQQNFTISAAPSSRGLEGLLGSWGVRVGEKIAVDPQYAGTFYWKVGGSSGGQRAYLVDFRWAANPMVGLGKGTVNRDMDLLGGFEYARFWFPSPLEIDPVEGIESTWMFRTGEEAWLLDPNQGVAPKPDLYPDGGYARPEDAEGARRTLAVALEGVFPSHFADKPIPTDRGEPEEVGDDGQPPVAESGGALRSSRKTRVVVVGNDDWVDNLSASISFDREFGAFPENVSFLEDAIGWLLEDDDLVGIRNRGRSFRPLEPTTEEERTLVQRLNFLVPAGLLGLLAAFLFVLRLNRRALV